MKTTAINFINFTVGDSRLLNRISGFEDGLSERETKEAVVAVHTSRYHLDHLGPLEADEINLVTLKDISANHIATLVRFEGLTVVEANDIDGLRVTQSGDQAVRVIADIDDEDEARRAIDVIRTALSARGFLYRPGSFPHILYISKEA